MAKQQSDKFANQAVITVTESAINTLTFKKLETGISLFEKMAWLIARMEYYVFDLSGTQFNAAADSLEIALTATDQLSAIPLTNAAVLDYLKYTRSDIGAAASGYISPQPYVKDFSTLPGGGLLVPPNPLYLAAKGTSLVAVSTVTAKILYTNYELSTEEYWELVESRRIISST